MGDFFCSESSFHTEQENDLISFWVPFPVQIGKHRLDLML